MAEAEERCRVGAIDFEVTSLEEAVERTLDDAFARRGVDVHFPNAWSIALANEDVSLQAAFGDGRNYPDGKPVVWAMRWMRRKNAGARAGHVGGHVFFQRAMELSVARGAKHYFLGGTPETLEKMKSRLVARFPSIAIVGMSSPPYKEHTAEDFERELHLIRQCDPDIVWVGLGTPKQDIAAAYMAPRYPAVFACIGAIFDFTAGNLRDAPQWVQEAGLAWLFRFAQEPRRLWRRYTYGNAKFIRIVVKQIRAG